ncbi:MAG: hypothetical protein QGF00_19940 [Planctomycetota bacterium]|jgi:hypothetical protein|nr:hypothetical protein [Planctomycetota bacterium]MDP7251891.1 hypothetical protein [Planctomycetota bacterium]
MTQRLIPSLFLLIAVSFAEVGYIVETITPPKYVKLEVGGAAFTPEGKLVMCTRRGEIWVTWGEGPERKWQQYSFGLQEPLGLVLEDDGAVVVLQRSELTRLRDTDKDGKADEYETICDDWGFSGNYHEYAFGLVRDKEGSYYGNLGLSFMKDGFKGTWLGTKRSIPWRGWHFKVTKEGKFVPIAPGMRAPNGICISPDEDVFITDNQGSYVASGWLMHATEGDLLGHPTGLIFDKKYKEPEKIPLEELNKIRKYPAVFFPNGILGRSTGSPIFDTTGGKFGPFAGQVFCGDVTTPILFRASLEKVQGEWQGAAYPFITGNGLLAGNNRPVFDKDGVLYIGQTARGWGRGEGLQRVKWGGEVPMEVHTLSLTKTGFELTFTLPVDQEAAKNPDTYSIQHWHYKYQPGYRAPQIGRTTVKADKVVVSKDGKKVSLALPELVPLKVYEFSFSNIKSQDGQGLNNTKAFYTLNRLRK